MALGLKNGVSWAGLAAGPAGWAINTETNYASSPWLCHSWLQVIVTGLVLIVIALGGAALSWRAWQSPQPGFELVSQANGEPRNFLAGMSALIAVLFALVIVMQCVSILILTGCER